MASQAPLKILYHAHPNLDTLDLAGPLEVLSQAKHASGEQVFHQTITAGSEYTTTAQTLTFKRHISLSDAYAGLADYDILIIPGGASPSVLDGQTEPLQLIKAFFELSKRQDGKTRTLLSVCTGSLFLAEAGVLDGLTATTHAKFYDELREVSSRKGKTHVVEERFVVNKIQEEKGLRIITSGGVSCGLDSCLWLIGEVAGKQSKEGAAATIQYAWRQGIVL